MPFKRGTTLHDDTRAHIDCANTACMNSAQIRTASANFCLPCYETWITKGRANRYEAEGRPTQKESMANIRRLSVAPKPTPREHWENVLSNTSATPETKAVAIECLRRMGASSTREPGQDDE